MNRRTFNDAVTSKVSSLANDVEDDDIDDEKEINAFRGNIEGEEEENQQVGILKIILIFESYRSYVLV